MKNFDVCKDTQKKGTYTLDELLLSNSASWSTNNARNEYKYHTIFVLVSFLPAALRLKNLAS